MTFIKPCIGVRRVGQRTWYCLGETVFLRGREFRVSKRRILMKKDHVVCVGSTVLNTERVDPYLVVVAFCVRARRSLYETSYWKDLLCVCSTTYGMRIEVYTRTMII